MPANNSTDNNVVFFFVSDFKIVYYKVNVVTLVEGDPKAPYYLATTPWCRGGRYLISCITQLYP